MITCSKCGSRVGVTGPCKTCAKLKLAAVNGIKYTTSRESQGRYSVHITDANGEYPQRVGYITGGKTTWLAECGPQSLGYRRTLKDAVQAIKDWRAVKAADGQPVKVVIEGAQA